MICVGETRGRDNNFDLIRVVAAFAVLFAHSSALLLPWTHRPDGVLQNFYTGTIAVDVFFLSGPPGPPDQHV